LRVLTLDVPVQAAFAQLLSDSSILIYQPQMNINLVMHDSSITVRCVHLRVPFSTDSIDTNGCVM
jgi:hypothetical protein